MSWYLLDILWLCLFQVGCRLWNLSLVSVLVLTVCNILLTVRLLHSECPSSPLPPQPRPPPPPLHIEPLIPCPACNLSALPPSLAVDPRLGRWDSARLFKMFDSVLVGDSFIEISSRYRDSFNLQVYLCGLQIVWSWDPLTLYVKKTEVRFKKCGKEVK